MIDFSNDVMLIHRSVILQLHKIMAYSLAILSEYSKDVNDNLKLNDTKILVSVTGACDELLQVFHRFDEGIGVEGKWQGGTVTGICRGWGTSKFVSLESIYQISDKVINSASENVEDCLLGLVNDLNSEPEEFVVPDKPCNVTLAGVVLKVGEVDDIIDDIKRKFTCLVESFRCQIKSENCQQPLVVDYCYTSVATLSMAGTSSSMLPYNPIFPGEVVYSPTFGFEWKFPISLPPKETRLRTNAYFLSDLLLGNSDLLSGNDDTTAERFIIDVFEEFMGCAVSSSSLSRVILSDVF